MTFVSQDMSVQDRVLQTLKREYITPRKTTANRQPCATILPQSVSKGDGRDILPLLDSRNFSWLSPISTVSTASSLASSDVLWDPPETPSGPSGKASSRSIQAPLTPPTPPGSSEKLSIKPIPKLSFGVQVGSVTKQQVFEKKDMTLQDDPFLEPKLFRGFTFDLKSISQKNIISTSVKFDINPSYDFTHDANDPVSARTRSKTSKLAPVTSVIHAALSEGISSVNTPQYRSNTPLQNKLRKLLEHILPLNLHERLAKESGRCAGSLVKDPSDRCKSNTKVWGVLGEVSLIVEKLARRKSQEDYRDMLGLIEQLVKSVMCGTHRNTALNQPKDKKRPNAKSKLVELGNMLKDIKSIGEDERLILMQWLDAISDLHAPIDHADWPCTTAAIHKPVRQVKSEAPNPVANMQASSSSSFIPYQSEKSKKLSVFDAVYQKAIAPLGVIAQKRGFVYLFWDKEYFGMVKIGYTKDLTKRLGSWNEQCKREHVYHSSTECQIEIPHAHRVEQLVHAELKEYRKRRQCEGCGIMHKEWFDAPQTHVVKVLRKWREWILQEPYTQDQKSGEWVIKPEMLGSLERMCEPLPQEVSIQKPRRKSGGLQRSQKKKKGARRTM